MTRGVAESMRKRGNKRHEELRGKKADAIRLWETEYKHIPRMSKNKAAALIGGRVGLVEVTVRGYLTGL